jgi:hypothetical protein
MSSSENSSQNVDAGEFDWDKINDDENLELCLIRVPDSVSFYYLDISPIFASHPSLFSFSLF